MSRILFWIILFVGGYWFWRRAKKAMLRAATQHMQNMTGAAPGGAAQRGAAAPSRQLAEPMVRCALCGAHAPQSEAVARYRQSFCCADHAQQYALAQGAGNGDGNGAANDTGTGGVR